MRPGVYFERQSPGAPGELIAQRPLERGVRHTLIRQILEWYVVLVDTVYLVICDIGYTLP